MPSPSNPFQDVNGNIQVEPGDHLPGIPQHRLKIGADYQILPDWTLGATSNVVSDFYYVGDASNQLAPIAGYRTVSLHSSYEAARKIEVFASINNLFNARYATWGILERIPPASALPGFRGRRSHQRPGSRQLIPEPRQPHLEAFAGVDYSLMSAYGPPGPGPSDGTRSPLRATSATARQRRSCV